VIIHDVCAKEFVPKRTLLPSKLEAVLHPFRKLSHDRPCVLEIIKFAPLEIGDTIGIPIDQHLSHLIRCNATQVRLDEVPTKLSVHAAHDHAF